VRVAVAVATPKASDDEQLLRLYQESGDLEAREELAVRFMPLARQLASRYRHSGEPLEDLAQVACVGLLKAIDRYDPERGTDFTRYALPTMLGELKRHFRDKGWALRVPRATQELALKVNEALGTLPAKLGRAARPRDVADAIGVSVEDVLEAMEAASARRPYSLDAAVGPDDDAAVLADTIGDEDPAFQTVEYGEAIARTLALLPERERAILNLRFVEDLTQSEIADRVGISQMHVSRLLRRALDAVREQVPDSE
jgi:RNA polymerase sigma-B factor